MLILLTAAVLLFGRLLCPLLEPEEALYAEIPRQMLSEGRFLTPVCHGQPFYHKPPLLYWLVMASYGLVGVNDRAAHLIPCLAAWGMVVLVMAWAGRRGGRRAAALSGLVLTLSPGFVYRGTMLGMDSLLALWVLAALAAAHEALASDTFRRGCWLLSAVACALGILTKGPVALVLIVIPLWVHGRIDPRVLRPGWRSWLVYLSVALGLACPWYVVLAWHAPQEAATFFWLHNVQRYLAPFDHAQPFWYFLPRLLGDMLPWTLLLFCCRVRTTSISRLCFLSCAWCLLFFSLSGCKRPGYILPAMPLLAMVLAEYLGHKLVTGACWLPARRTGLLLTGGLAVVLLAGVYLVLPLYHVRFSLRRQVMAVRHLAKGNVVACFPHRWDSVAFYLDRLNVRIYDGPDLKKMVADLQSREQTILFVKSRLLHDFRASLPATLEFVVSSPMENVTSGIVRVVSGEW